MEKDIELLSPAGNADALRAAVRSGADAVYIGGPLFNARRSAKNFSIDEIGEYADYCHLYGVDLHVAVNTLIKEKELPALLEYVRKLNDVNVDALIVQDLGAAHLIHKECPQLPLHASTQMTVTSAEGVKYLEDAGFSRVVLARELSKKEIEYIVKHTKAEIEVFVHGALCMCYSGQCLMSSIIGGRSANRGRCAQPCRLPYTLCSSDGLEYEGYILSPKDLALIEEISELRSIGVTSLKIEGRLKRAEYVSAVTGIYRKYLDNPGRVTDDDMAELRNAFSRSGFTKGYFLGQTGRSMMSGKNPGNTSKNTFTDAAKKRALSDTETRKIPVTVSGTLKCGAPISVTMTDEDYNSVTVSGAISQKAINVPLDNERFKQQLARLGGTPFDAEYVFCETDGISTVSIKDINDARRRACAELVKKRTERAMRKTFPVVLRRESVKKKPKKIMLNAECKTAHQAEICLALGADAVYVDDNNGIKDGESVVLKTGDIFSSGRKRASAYEVASPAAARFYGDTKTYCGFRMNVYNSYTAELFKNAELVTLSPELNVHEIRDAAANTSAKTEVIAYGRLPLMLMKNCPVRAVTTVRRGVRYSLRDRKNRVFPLAVNDVNPTVLLNSAPIFTADRLSEITALPIDAIRLIFTDEDAELTEQIFVSYRRALDGERVENPFGENEFTRGHFFRGVE